MPRSTPQPLLELALSLVCLPLAGCGGCGADSAAGPGAREPATAAGASSPQSGEPDPSSPTKAGPPPDVTVRSEVGEDGRRATLVVESRGEGPVELAPRARVERQTDDGWTPLGTLTLRWSCDAPPPRRCIELVRGAELHPPPWLGRTGDAQCACEDCDPVPAGSYRFVVHGCGNGAVVASQPFTLGPP